MVHQTSGVSLSRSIRTGKILATDAIDSALRQIYSENPSIGAALAINTDAAREKAATIDEAVANGRPVGPMAGIPLIVKDNLCTKGLATTAASRILENHIPPYTATAVARLEVAGAIVIAKANLDEFAMGSSCEHSAFGVTKNPWDTDRVPGGSSGGSAAAVAAGWAPIALGSDTGGSIRQPASLCGVYGLKPTWGRVSRNGLIAFASSLDQIGPFSRSVEDLALTMQTMAGIDSADTTTANVPVPNYSDALTAELTSLRIGRCTEWMEADGIEPAVKEAVERALATLCELGATVVDINLPSTDAALAAYYTLAPAEASSNLARYDGVRFGARHEASTLSEMYEHTRGSHFGTEVQRRILLGTFVLSDGYKDAYYGKAQRVRREITRQYQHAFGACDVIVSPTSPVVAPAIGSNANPLAMYRMDQFTIGPNLAGLPALNVPCGKAGALPIGLQVIAPAFEETRLLSLAAAYERDVGCPEVSP